MVSLVFSVFFIDFQVPGAVLDAFWSSWRQHGAQVAVHKAFVEVHKARVEVHNAEVEAHKGQVAVHKAHVEAHRTLANHRNSRDASKVKLKSCLSTNTLD